MLPNLDVVCLCVCAVCVVVALMDGRWEEVGGRRVGKRMRMRTRKLGMIMMMMMKKKEECRDDPPRESAMMVM